MHFIGAHDRLNDFILGFRTSGDLISNVFLDEEVCHQHNGNPGPGKTVVITCSIGGPTHARYVYIYVPGDQRTLTLCEVQVYEFTGMLLEFDMWSSKCSLFLNLASVHDNVIKWKLFPCYWLVMISKVILSVSATLFSTHPQQIISFTAQPIMYDIQLGAFITHSNTIWYHIEHCTVGSRPYIIVPKDTPCVVLTGDLWECIVRIWKTKLTAPWWHRAIHATR